MKMTGFMSTGFAAILALGCAMVGTGSHAKTFIPLSAEPAGEYDGIEYVEHFGLFAGITAKGQFVMPYQIFAPADPDEANAAVVIEPPHFAFGPGLGREAYLGRDMLFSRGFSHASVGFSELVFNILAPIPGLQIAGAPAALCDPGTDPDCEATRDVEIIKQFAEALKSDPYAATILGTVDGLYAFGGSQTSEVLLEMMYGLGIEGLFDLSLLSITVWQLEYPTFRTGIPEPGAIPDDFFPLDGIGKVMIVNAEGDRFISEAEELGTAVGHPDYRLWEVAGAPHFASVYLPLGFPGTEALNPLDVGPAIRAALVAGHQWVRGEDAPPNALLAAAEPGTVDPVYGFETGIARDANGNALGGVRLPDVAVGRGLYVAWTDVPLPVPGGAVVPLLGLFVDLACEPAPGSNSDGPRFRNHGRYVSAFAREAAELVEQGFLLRDEAERMVAAAAESNVGKRASCGDDLPAGRGTERGTERRLPQHDSRQDRR